MFTCPIFKKACIHLVIQFQGQRTKPSLLEHDLREKSGGERASELLFMEPGSRAWSLWPTMDVIMRFTAGALMLSPSAKSAVHTLFGYGIH